MVKEVATDSIKYIVLGHRTVNGRGISVYDIQSLREIDYFWGYDPRSDSKIHLHTTSVKGVPITYLYHLTMEIKSTWVHEFDIRKVVMVEYSEVSKALQKRLLYGFQTQTYK